MRRKYGLDGTRVYDKPPHTSRDNIVLIPINMCLGDGRKLEIRRKSYQGLNAKPVLPHIAQRLKIPSYLHGIDLMRLFICTGFYYAKKKTPHKTSPRMSRQVTN